MISVSERNFHLLMGALLLGSVLLDRLMRAALPAWQMPQVTLLTLVLGLIWIGLFTVHRVRTLQERLRVLEDRLQRNERKADALEVELKLRDGRSSSPQRR
jgi:hypothetical protein